MDPKGVFCDNPVCPHRGQADQGNIKIHSRKEQRFRCFTCKKTFAASKGTPFYRLHKDDVLLVCVVTLLAHGCPLPAIVVAYGLDERTVADWRDKAGTHCQAVHQHHLESKPLASFRFAPSSFSPASTSRPRKSPFPSFTIQPRSASMTVVVASMSFP